MIKRISRWIHLISYGWVTLGALMVFVLFTILVLPKQSTSGQPKTENVGTPDLSFYYTPEDLYNMADAYGAQGRRDYIKARFTFDVAWPIVYTAFLATALSWLSRQGFDKKRLWQRSNLLPLFGATFDYLENISTSIVMARYPKTTTVVDVLASVFTPLKWICIGISFVLLIYAFGKVIGKKLFFS